MVEKGLLCRRVAPEAAGGGRAEGAVGTAATSRTHAAHMLQSSHRLLITSGQSFIIM